MIEQLQGFPDNDLAFVGRGRITRADYTNVLTPAVETALPTHKRVRLYYELAPDFAGIDPGAMWEDFKVGVEHLTRWERVAVVTDIESIRQATRLFGFMIPGAINSFPISGADEARVWVAAAG